MNRKRVWLGAALTALLVAGGAGAASADPSAQPCAGVLVSVDPGEEHDLVSRCATQHPNGSAALASAGFTVVRQGGMICRIDDWPAACTITLTDYWSYWRAARNPDGSFGPWVYSSVGADTSRPRAGDAEGWSFGHGGVLPPRELPPAGATAVVASGEASSPGVPSPPPSSGSPSADGPATVPAGTLLTAGVLLAGGGALAVWWRKGRRR